MPRDPLQLRDVVVSELHYYDDLQTLVPVDDLRLPGGGRAHSGG